MANDPSYSTMGSEADKYYSISMNFKTVDERGAIERNCSTC